MFWFCLALSIFNSFITLSDFITDDDVVTCLRSGCCCFLAPAAWHCCFWFLRSQTATADDPPLPCTGAPDHPFEDDAFADNIMDLAAMTELVNAAREDEDAQKDAAEEADQDQAGEQEQPKRQRRHEQSSSSSMSALASSFPERNNRSTSSLGISGVARVRRAGMKCFHCECGIDKGDVRFEFTFNKNRPPRSIHPTCLSKIEGESLNGSISYLNNLLTERPPSDRDEYHACQDAVNILQSA